MAAAHVARAAPRSWEELLQAMDTLVTGALHDCAAASSDRVGVAQGRAQQLIELRDLLGKCVRRAVELEEKQKAFDRAAPHLRPLSPT